LIVLYRLADDYEVVEGLVMMSLGCYGEKEFQISLVPEITEL